jgi:hypothetical protein
MWIRALGGAATGESATTTSRWSGKASLRVDPRLLRRGRGPPPPLRAEVVAHPGSSISSQERSGISIQAIGSRKLSEISSKLSGTRIRSESDEVFESADKSKKSTHLPNSFGSVLGSGSKTESQALAGQAFPPVYNIIRANKNRLAAATPLTSNLPSLGATLIWAKRWVEGSWHRGISGACGFKTITQLRRG